MNTMGLPFLIGGLVFFLISLPLIYRKVPMNSFYGVRVPAAFESKERWYEINAYGGRLLAIGSLVIVVVGIVGLFLPPEYGKPYALCAIPVVLLSVLVPPVWVLIWSSRLGKQSDDESRQGTDRNETGVRGSRPQSSAERLHELDGMFRRQQISEREYEAKRQEILKEL